ncbi:MAG TPA: hypothetical protein VFQ53_17995 [Kofleriaceae bacterium]|nr:hypothetical protein [Kofleriaceae bacterium]
MKRIALLCLVTACSTAVRHRPVLHDPEPEPEPEPVVEDTPERTPAASAPAMLPSAKRDPDGRLILPDGGPLATKQATCDAEHDHCLRAGAWFVVEPYRVGELRKATPVFELEGYWYGWNAVRADGAVYRTEVATPAALFPGRPVIVLADDGSTMRWPDSEAAALVTKRWRIGVIERVDPATATILIAGTAFPIAATRITVETR